MPFGRQSCVVFYREGKDNRNHHPCIKKKEKPKLTKEQRLKILQKKKEALETRFGNYHQYYGYRNKGEPDKRIQCIKKEWIFQKDVLDIGCNAGHLTLCLARDFEPRSIIGIDIDNTLVKMAMKNVRHYLTEDNIEEDSFPLSLALTYGPVAQAFDPKSRYSSGRFPFNVQFLQHNYILPTDNWLIEQQQYFDTILCLSLTKWVHLNWGDAGIRTLFHRIFRQLRAGGHMILEAQTFGSYSRKKKLTEEIFENYKDIQLLPEMFNDFLLGEVGFKSCELIDIPNNLSKGFSRPIYLFKKAEATPMKKPVHIIYNDTLQNNVFYNNTSENSCDNSDVEELSD